jgi:hypothetical protein
LKAVTRLDALEATKRFVRAVKHGTPGIEYGRWTGHCVQSDWLAEPTSLLE